MGLKWFRARIKMDKKNVNETESVGFYRQFSQFDCESDNKPSPSESISFKKQKIIPVSPPVVPNLLPPQNPMASLTKNSDGKNMQNGTEQQDKDFDDYNRIHYLQNTADVNNSRETGNKINKLKSKKIKDRAPIPQAVSSENKNDVKLQVKVQKDYKESETEI